jgi:hypothetical protein
MVRPKAGSGHLGGPTGLVAFILLSTTLHLLTVAESPVQYGMSAQILNCLKLLSSQYFSVCPCPRSWYHSVHPLSHDAVGSRFQIEILVQNRSVVLEAPLNEDSHYLAEVSLYILSWRELHGLPWRGTMH